MRKLYLPIMFALLLTPLLTANDVIGNIASLIGQGDAHKLAAYFAGNIEVSLPGDSKTYTYADAEQALLAFFAKNRRTEVRVIHRVTSNPNYQYAVFSLGAGKSAYHINITLKQMKGSLRLIEFRIEFSK